MMNHGMFVIIVTVLAALLGFGISGGSLIIAALTAGSSGFVALLLMCLSD